MLLTLAVVIYKASLSQDIKGYCSNEQEGSYLQSLLWIFLLQAVAVCTVVSGHIWGEFYFMSQIWFEKSKIIKQAFKCNILAENAPPPHFQLNSLPQQNIYIWTKNTYLLKYKDVSEIKNTFPIYKGTFLLYIRTFSPVLQCKWVLLY